MPLKLLNYKHHPKVKYQARVFDMQEGYRFTFSLRNETLFIETGAYLHWNKNKIVDIAFDISSMSGCSYKCKFCASADYFKGILTSDEIVQQVIFSISLVQEKQKEFFNNCELLTFSFEGMGEPSLPKVSQNILNAIDRLKLLLANKKQKIQFIISTIGANPLVIKEWANKKIPIETLQISVHGVSDHLRSFLLGKNHPSLSEIIDALIYFQDKCPNVLIKINYLMLHVRNIGSNISKNELNSLISLLKNTGFLLKLSHLNLTESSKLNNIHPVSEEEVKECFQFVKKNYPNTYKYGTIQEIEISCGQLASYAENLAIKNRKS